MAKPRQLRNLIFNLSLSSALTALAIAFLLIVVATQPAQAQTFHVIHNFTGGQDGATPTAGVTLDTAGNLYGTASYGGVGYGTVYKLTHKGTFNPLFAFNYNDGAYPLARVIFGPNGTLYGTTNLGGLGVGTVFNLRPAARACTTALCPWTETVLYSFEGHPDGAGPDYGDLIFDQAGNIYGTTTAGGTPQNVGTVYELTPKSGGGYAEMPIYSFSVSDGATPYNGAIFDNAGNLYSTTGYGGLSNSGTVFELMYVVASGWTESLLYSFRNGSDGGVPYAGLIFDPSGNLYGATSAYGTGGGGTVFELSPPGTWTTLTVLYSFTGTAGHTCGPWGTLVMKGGNLYGTTYCDGANGFGSVFELTPSGPPWTYTSLHDFTGGSDGAYPISNVVFDASGNLYGTASDGGAYNFGVVWEITP